MSFAEILVVALALSLDAAAVCLAASTAGFVTNERAAFRLYFHFGLFQFLMPVLGWALGNTVEPLVTGIDHWVACTLLVIVAARMIYAGLVGSDTMSVNDPSRGLTLVMLSTATSLDALAVGLSLAMLRVRVLYPSLVIGIVTALMCMAAIAIGHRVSGALGKRAQLAGGAILMLIAARILIVHLRG